MVIFRQEKGKAVKDGNLTKFGYDTVPGKKPTHTTDPEMETITKMA